MNNVLAIVQARLGSSRFKNKVIAPLSNTTVIGYMLRRIAKSKCITKIIVAIPYTDFKLKDLISTYGIETYEGSENNVLDRFYSAAKHFQAYIIVRLTADCPLVDPGLIDEMITRYKEDEFDYLGFGSNPTYPDGLGTEVLNYESLYCAWKYSKNSDEKEHVTLYIRNNPDKFKIGIHSLDKDYSYIRLTLDYPEDLAVIQNIVNTLDKLGDECFGYNDVIKLYNENPLIFTANKYLAVRNYSSLIKISDVKDKQ